MQCSTATFAPPGCARVCNAVHSAAVLVLHLDALGEVRLLTRLCFFDLPMVQVAALEGLVQALQRDAVDDVDGVDHVAERLGHFATVSISHHGMQVDLLRSKVLSIALQWR